MHHLARILTALAMSTLCACQTSTPEPDPTPTPTPETSTTTEPAVTPEPTKELPLTPPTTSPTSSIDSEGLTTELVPAPDGYASGDPITLTFVVRNPGEADRTFCDYHTPFEGIRNDLFEIRDASGAEVAYQGIMAKRSPPDADDYLLVRAGTRAEAPIDLTSKYTLGSGDYTIRFTGNAISGLPASNTVTITVP